MSDVLAPFIDNIVEILLALIAAFILPPVYSYFKVSADDKRRALVETALQNGITWALAKVLGVHNVTGDLLANYLNNPANRAELLDRAEEYVWNAVKESLGKLGVDKSSLRAKIEARLPELLNYLK